VIYSLAFVEAIERDWDRATESFERARALYEQLGKPVEAASANMGVGMVMDLRGEHEAALPILAASVSAFRQAGYGFGLRNTISIQTRALTHLGRNEQARQINHEHIALSHTDHDPTALSTAVLDAASLAALDGEWERAARLIGAGQRIIEESGGQPPPELIDRIEPLPVLREEMDQATLDELIAAGRRMSTDEVVAYALSDRPGP
jgi:hypothetical protein